MVKIFDFASKRDEKVVKDDVKMFRSEIKTLREGLLEYRNPLEIFSSKNYWGEYNALLRLILINKERDDKVSVASLNKSKEKIKDMEYEVQAFISELNENFGKTKIYKPVNERLGEFLSMIKEDELLDKNIHNIVLESEMVLDNLKSIMIHSDFNVSNNNLDKVFVQIKVRVVSLINNLNEIDSYFETFENIKKN